MIPSIKVTGIEKLRVEFRNIADKVPDAARGQMRRSAARIVEEAKLNTPEDDKLLVQSIKILKDYGTRGRLQIDIVAGGGEVLGPDGMVNLDQYAALVHENYESGVAYKNGPGARTLRKMARNPGRIIGSGFLTRAADAEEPKLAKKMITVLQAAIDEEMS